MGDTHFRSNIIEQADSSITASVNAITANTITANTTLTMPSSTAMTTPNFSGGASIKLHNNSYIIWGSEYTAAEMEAAATALTTTATPVSCVYICTLQNAASGGVFFRGANAASWTTVYGIVAA